MLARRIGRILAKTLMGLGLAALVLLAAELVCWLVGIKPVIMTCDPLVGFAHSETLFQKSSLADGTPIYRTRPGKLQWFNDQHFRSDKPEGAYRIFCLGGSTTYGRPYEDKVSFPGCLRALLKHAVPDRKWEVVNAGGVSYASYRVARLMQELVEYKPDLFIVYCGHNEFLEQRTYGGLKESARSTGALRAAAMRSRMYALVDKAMKRPGENTVGRKLLPAEVQPVLDNVVGPSAYERDDELAMQVAHHYRLSVERMIALARGVGAGIIFVMPGANLKDMSPFKSEHVPGYRKGDMDPRHARTQYELGRRFFLKKDYPSAKAAFLSAIDEDVCPLRMTSPLRQALREVCTAHKVDLVDYPAIIEQDCERRYGHGIPGSEYFHDHVHPKIDMTFALGAELLRSLTAMGIANTPEVLDSQAVAAVKEALVQGLTDEEHGRAMLNLSKVLFWAGKFEEAKGIVDQAVAALPESGEAWYLQGMSRAREGDKMAAKACYMKTVALSPDDFRAHNNLGMLYLAEGAFAEAEFHFRKSIQVRPRQAPAHYNLGNLFAGRKEFVSAEAAYRRALEADAGNVLVLGNLGNVLAEQGRWEDAIKVYRRVLKMAPNDPAASRNLTVAEKMAARTKGKR